MPSSRLLSLLMIEPSLKVFLFLGLEHCLCVITKVINNHCRKLGTYRRYKAMNTPHNSIIQR